MLRLSATWLLLLLGSLAACQSVVVRQATQLPPTVVSTPVVSSRTPKAPATPTPENVPTLTIETQHDLAIYRVAIETFLQDGQVQHVLQSDPREQKTVFITPTFSNTNIAIPDALMQLILAHTSAQGLTQIQSEQPGAAVIALSVVGNDPNAAIVYQRRGPTVWISARISGSTCGSSIDIGYLMTPNAAGWQAQQYMLAVC